jgi:D-ala D-ala ligase N-terminal domain protein
MIKLGIIYGGVSTEHDISLMSAKSVIENLDKEKYEIHEIYINKYGKWYDVRDDEIEEIYNLIWTLKKLDVVFPVLHGLGGEDGTIQGMLEMLQVPYVGCKVLASSVGMDKVYTKIIFEKAGIPEAPYVYIKKKDNGYIIVNENFEEEEFKVESITKKLNYPMFVKPSNSGSSVGVKKATNNEELKMAIENASQYDNKILIEQGINAREVECAILDGTEVRASTVGEIMSAEEFYSFDAKYNIPESKTIIPADISKEQIEQIQKLAIRAFKAIDGRGLARADFFIEKDTNKIYINEINTMPGFTKISMYPKLFEAVGITYTELLDKLIENTK